MIEDAMFHNAKLLAFGLKIVTIIPDTNIPIAAKTSEKTPVIMLAVEAENKKLTSMYLT